MKVAAFWENPPKIGQHLATIQQNSGKMFVKKKQNCLVIFNEQIEIRERCKGVHCVDLGESFPIFFFQFPSMSLFLNLLFEQRANSNEYSFAKSDRYSRERASQSVKVTKFIL